MEDLNNTINQWDVTDICRTLHPTTEGYTFFFSRDNGTFTKMPYLDHKAKLNKLKRI